MHARKDTENSSSKKICFGVSTRTVCQFKDPVQTDVRLYGERGSFWKSRDVAGSDMYRYI